MSTRGNWDWSLSRLALAWKVSFPKNWNNLWRMLDSTFILGDYWRGSQQGLRGCLLNNFKIRGILDHFSFFELLDLVTFISDKRWIHKPSVFHDMLILDFPSVYYIEDGHWEYSILFFMYPCVMSISCLVAFSISEFFNSWIIRCPKACKVFSCQNFFIFESSWFIFYFRWWSSLFQPSPFKNVRLWPFAARCIKIVGMVSSEDHP